GRVARGRELAGRLAAAELAADRPVKALEHLVEAEQPAAVGALLEARWAELAGTVPLGLFGRLFERFGDLGTGEPFRGSSLLRLLAEALLWRRESALGELERRCTEVGELGRACALIAPLLPPGGGDGHGDPVPEPSLLPPELRPLVVLLSLSPAPEGGESEVDLAAEAARLVPALVRVPPGGPRPAGLEGIHGLAPLQALFGGALADLLRRRPLLAAELRGRRDLPVAWRRWLAGLPPAALAGEAAGYTVSLLGHPTVRLRRPEGGSQELAFKLRRSFEVFAFLATTPGFAATRREIEQAVWEDEDEDTVDKNFHPTLSHLRRSLGSGGGGPNPVLLRRGVYRLNARLAWNVDAVELVRRADEGRDRMREGQPEQAAELWRSAWSLYGGPLLAGWDGRWITERRDALARRYYEMLRDLGEVNERLGRWTEAMDAYRAVLIEDPVQEPVHLGLMRVYARQGRRDQVRRQYERLVALLREELGHEPEEETALTYRRLMG
ncbi:MAG TPA: bacterial transcriptional activator domain-containing protein, partial [Thermoanaerobaculia bacterium]|nr:bacterial transcriptional activator domain-containing protein [Thermoanaerobaculia bacterium]